MNATLAVALIAAVLGPLVAYVTTSRKLSGKIGTSDADALWRESKDVREFTAEQLKIANARISTLEELISSLRKRLDRADDHNEDLSRRLERAEAENEECRREIAKLSATKGGP